MIKRILCTLAIAACAALSLPASAALLTDYGENKLVDAFFRGQALGTPATWYVGVSTGTCNDATSGTEPTGGYARQPVSASLSAWAGTQSAGSTAASSGTGATTSNNAIIQFPASTAAWGNVLQRVSGGVVGADYLVVARAVLSDGQVREFAAVLPVRRVF